MPGVQAGGQLTREEAHKRAVYQLLSKEQSYSLALTFGVSRFLVPLSERRDLIAPQEHQTLFQNIQEVSVGQPFLALTLPKQKKEVEKTSL